MCLPIQPLEYVQHGTEKGNLFGDSVSTIIILHILFLVSRLSTTLFTLPPPPSSFIDCTKVVSRLGLQYKSRRKVQTFCEYVHRIFQPVSLIQSLNFPFRQAIKSATRLLFSRPRFRFLVLFLPTWHTSLLHTSLSHTELSHTELFLTFLHRHDRPFGHPAARRAAQQSLRGRRSLRSPVPSVFLYGT